MPTPVPPLVGEFDTVGAALDAAAEQYRDREAYVDGAQRLTFAEWARAADGLAAALADRGVRRGDVVALMLPSSIDYAICYGAIAKLGAITTGLNTRLGPREVTAILDRSRPKLVIRDGAAGLPSSAPPAGVAASAWRAPRWPPRILS
jgi:acyl-CoA synthetase (AMP-forming)/AMP-acid ligase II